MVWGAFSYNATTDIVFLKGRRCAEKYQKMLKSQLLSFGKLLGRGRMDISARQLLHSRAKLYNVWLV